MKTLAKFFLEMVRALAKRLLPHIVDRIVKLFAELTGLKFEVLLFSAD